MRADEPSISECLADRLDALASGEFPSDVLEKGKIFVLDSLSCMLAARGMPEARSYVELYAGEGGNPECSVVGWDTRLPMLRAGNVNGFLANLADFDDNLQLPSGLTLAHPGAVAVPAALAVAQAVHANGLTLLRSVIAAYDVSARVAMSVLPSHEQRTLVWGWGTYQIFGAVAAAAIGLQLDREQSINALGLCPSFAPLPFIRKIGYDLRPLLSLKNHYGWTVEGGLTAALLARQGFVGHRKVFEGPSGFWKMAGSDQFDPSLLVEASSNWDLLAGVTQKPYPYCRNTHPALEALESILTTSPIRPENVASIVVTGPAKLRDYFDVAPRNIIDAEFSLPQALGVRMCYGLDFRSWLSPIALSDPRVRAIASSVRLIEDPDRTELYSSGVISLELQLVDSAGRSHSANSTSRLPSTDLSLETTSKKFLNASVPVLGVARSQAVVSSVCALERVKDVAIGLDV